MNTIISNAQKSFTLAVAPIVAVIIGSLTFPNSGFGQINAQATRPYVLILPGVLGKQFWDENLLHGIQNSVFQGEAEIYDWTNGPLAIAQNIGGSDIESDFLTQRIVDFKTQFPNRPLFLIGHSGGCRMALNCVENLPYGSSLVERIILLSPCMESRYDLCRTINRTSKGIVAYRSPLDIPISVPLTTVHGLAKGKLSASAAVIGFQIPNHLDFQQRAFYTSKLAQRTYHPKMLNTGHIGGHFGWTLPSFAATYIVNDLR
ncbi:MAG: hypothetical protein AAGA30_02875 [Planctomycetota bacterium]